MAEDELEGLLNSHVVPCRGASRNESPVFPAEGAETVIVKVYKNGKTEPLCRYLQLGCVTPRCNPERRSMSEGEDGLGVCPYSSI